MKCGCNLLAFFCEYEPVFQIFRDAGKADFLCVEVLLEELWRIDPQIRQLHCVVE